jgi:hypothetical protein
MDIEELERRARIMAEARSNVERLSYLDDEPSRPDPVDADSYVTSVGGFALRRYRNPLAGHRSERTQSTARPSSGSAQSAGLTDAQRARAEAERQRALDAWLMRRIRAERLLMLEHVNGLSKGFVDQFHDLLNLIERLRNDVIALRAEKHASAPNVLDLTPTRLRDVA